jgi:Novel STAND NTPase 1
VSSGEGVAQVPREPYRGIAPYRYADRHVFFARERQVQALVRAVVINRAMLLYGASGAGKSSLVNAGLLPAAIEAGFAPERIRVQPRVDQELVVERIAVSDDPADGYLPSALLDADGSSSRQVLSAAGLRERIEAVQGRDAVPLLLFDQFEELATLFPTMPADGPAARASRAIVDLIVDLVRDRDLSVKLLLVFREDYLATIRARLERCPNLQDHFLRLARPPVSALEEIVFEPFRRYPGAFGEPPSAALGAMLAAVADRYAAGELGLSEVQLAALRLWRADDADRLFREKGIDGLLEDALSDGLAGLPEGLREPALSVLERLVTSSGTRNVVSEDDLVATPPGDGAASEDELREVLARLEEARIVQREARREVHVFEIVSEALVPSIGELRRERAERRARARHREVVEKLEHERRLRRGIAVLAGLALLALLGVAVLAIRASDSESSARRAERAARAADARAQAERARAVEKADALTRAQRVSVSRELALASLAERDVKRSVSLLLALNAAHFAPTAQADSALRFALAPSSARDAPRVVGSGGGQAAAFTPAGDAVATVGARATTVFGPDGARLGAAPLPLADIAVAPDGGTVAGRDPRGVVGAWRVRDGRRDPGLALRAPVPVRLRFDHAGTTLLAVDRVGAVRALAVPGFARRWSARVPAGVRGAAFSADDRRVVLVDADGAVRVLDAATGAPIETRPGAGAPVRLVAVDDATSGARPAVAEIATAGGRDELSITDGCRSGRPAPTLLPEGEHVVGLALAARGANVIAITSRGDAWVVDGCTGLVWLRFPDVTAAAFSPRGSFVALVQHDGRVRVADISVARDLGTLPAPATARGAGPVLDAIRFSSDGGRLLWSARDGTARVATCGDTCRLSYADLVRRATAAAAALPPEERTLTCAEQARFLRTVRDDRLVPIDTRPC